MLRGLEEMNQVIPIYLVSLTCILFFSVFPVVLPHLIDRYFDASDAIDNHNSMWQSDLSLDKYWVYRMAILDLQLQCHWVWVLYMGSSYTVVVF